MIDSGGQPTAGAREAHGATAETTDLGRGAVPGHPSGTAAAQDGGYRNSASEHGRSAPSWPEGSDGDDGSADRSHRPGSEGEHSLQRALGSVDRADRFYDEQVLDHLNERMREFTERQEMFFLATSDGKGECDSSFRAGPAGFLRVLDERTLVYPEYRGNGVHASLGNIQENPNLGILMIDFLQARIGLHINGRAQVLDDAEIRGVLPDLPADPVPGRRARLWVRVDVEEAYIHCAKHIPHLQKAPKRTAREWGTDDYKRKGGDFFGSARDARESSGPTEQPAREHRRHAAPVGGPGTDAVAAGAGTVPAAASADGPAGRPTAGVQPVPPVPAAAPVTAGSAESAAAGASAHPGSPGQDVPAAPPVPPGAGAGARSGAEVPGAPPVSAADAVPAQPAVSPQPATPVRSGDVGTMALRPALPPAGPPEPEAPATVHGSGPAPDGPSGAVVPTVEDVESWRRQAELALAEAQRLSARCEPTPFEGWFASR